MDINDIVMNIEKRVQVLEQGQASLRDRMGKNEDKVSSAWHTIQEVNVRMDKIETKVDGLEKDVKQLKVMQEDTNKGIKTLTKIIAVLCVIVGAFFIYIWKHDESLAKSILSLGTTLAGVV